MASCDCSDSPHEPIHGWSLRLLDGWQLCRRAAEVAEVPRRERRLLSLLALRGERPRAQIASVLWPDSPEVKAQGNLRAAVWHIQHRHEGVLEDRQGLLRLSPRVRVDVDQLREVLGQLAAGTDVDVDRTLVLRILGHEDLLPGWSEQWLDEERALLHHLRLRALEQFAEVLLGKADVEGAMMVALRAVALDPYRESVHRSLIRVHLAEGNHVEAVRVYETFSERLRDELGVTVSPHLHRLVHPLLVPAGRQLAHR